MLALLTLGVEVDWGQELISCSFEEDCNHSLWARRNLATPQLTAHATSCLTFLLRLIRVGVLRELSATLGPLTHCYPLFLLVITQLEKWTKKPSMSCKKKKHMHILIHTHKNTNPQPSNQWYRQHCLFKSWFPEETPEGHLLRLRHLIKPRSPLMSEPVGWWTAKGSFMLFPLGCSIFPQWIQPLVGWIGLFPSRLPPFLIRMTRKLDKIELLQLWDTFNWILRQAVLENLKYFDCKWHCT